MRNTRPKPQAALRASAPLMSRTAVRQCKNSPMPHPPSPPASPPSPPAQPRNRLHGLTLEAIVTALADHYGWAELGVRIPVRCFTHEPGVASSLKFLRKTPWAREKVEGLYLFMLRELRRGRQ